MWNPSTICKKVGMKELVGAKDFSGRLGVLFRRWATTDMAAAGSTKTSDVSKLSVKRVMPGNAIERPQGVRFHLYSYILASHQMEPGSTVMNCDLSKHPKGGSFQRANFTNPGDGGVGGGSSSSSAAYRYGILDPNSQVGNCMPLADIRMGTWVHDIECHPGQGAKLARSAGTFAKVVKEPGARCLLRLPSGVEKLVDSRCRATIGVVSNSNHRVRKLKKAGETRWRGRRPVVRGVAMNPVDHPHGGGEGRTKGGRPSVSPWGKPTKSGYKTVLRKNVV
ncbi:hypothetical protein Taro_006121 [Colocasia esculenta]|uniref:Large ribosomal subunit protein uL2m n=1 Tax=Colocasia esculenta TaxID=4460 RepID=A0A843TZS7_COLES|nr:hypothetical protein [Colocasia esculenta]